MEFYIVAFIAGEMLQRIEVRETAIDNCADISIMSGNTLCAGSTFDPSECNVSVYEYNMQLTN